MSAQSIHPFQFLTRAAGRETDDSAGHPAGSQVVRELLRQWRAAERGLAELDPDSETWALLKAEIDGLRQRYQEAFNALVKSDQTGSSA